MSTVNLYDVLNLSQGCSKREIKDSYRKLVKEFHPDKPEGDAEMFELITHAYNILSNTKSRKEYDNLFKISKESETDHFDLRQKSKDYFEAEKTNVIKKDKKEQKKEFDKLFSEMDIKHKYKRDLEDKPMDGEDLSGMIKDLQWAREQEDIENIHEKMFKEGNFDLSKFNAAFDALHNGSKDVIAHTGNPQAWNTINNNPNFTSLESYESLYAEKEEGNRTIYDSADYKQISMEEVEGLDPADYTINHNSLTEEEFEDILKKKLAERELESTKFEKMSHDDFIQEEPTDSFGIFDKINPKKVNELIWQNDEDLKTKYKKLLETRKKEPDS